MAESSFRYIAKKRRPKEDRRFLAGSGRFVADLELPGMLHVALVGKPAPFRADRVDRCGGGDEAAGRARRRHGRRDRVRHRADDERARSAEDAALAARGRARALCRRMGGGGRGGNARASRGRGRACGHRLRGAAGGGRSRGGDRSRRAARPSRARLEPALSPQVRVGAGRTGFRRGAAPHLLSRALAPQRHRADRDVRRSRALGFLGAALEIWASIQMPKYADQLARALRLPGNAVRVHYDVDVGGSYGGKRGLKHAVLACVSRAAFGRARPLHRGPARKSARRRRARARPHLRRSDGVRRRRHRARDEDARARRCRRLCRARAVPARQTYRRHRRPLSHRQRRIRADQRHHQQDAGGGRARLRPGAYQFRDRDRHGFDRAASGARPDRAAPAQPDPARRVSLHDPERQLL